MGLWAGQSWRSRGRRAQPGQPSGQLEGHDTLLAADASGQGCPPAWSCSWASVMSLSCHHAPQLLAELQWPQGQSGQAGQQQSRAVSGWHASICGCAGFSACRAVTPEQVVASPLGGEQGVGGVWILLTQSDLSCLQPGQGFLLGFHLGTISNVSEGQ